MGTGVLLLGFKRPEPEHNHSPPFFAEVKNEWSYTSTSLHVRMMFTALPSLPTVSFYYPRTRPVRGRYLPGQAEFTTVRRQTAALPTGPTRQAEAKLRLLSALITQSGTKVT